MKKSLPAKTAPVEKCLCTVSHNEPAKLVCAPLKSRPSSILPKHNNLDAENTTLPSKLVIRKPINWQHPRLLKALSSNHHNKLSSAASRNTSTTISTRSNRNEVTVICANSFGPNVNRPYVIKAPGKYRLDADITFNHTDPLTPVILINPGVNNVDLDLNQHTLTQGNDTVLAYGIWIGMTYFGSGTGNSNLTIRNGSIVGFTGGGILAFSNGYDEIYNDLHFFDLNILQNGIPGEDVDFSLSPGLSLNTDPTLVDTLLRPLEPEDATYRNIIIDRVRVNDTVGGAGGLQALSIGFYNNLIIRNTEVNRSLMPFQDGIGYDTFAYALYGVNLQMHNCQGNDTRNEDTNVGQVGGIDHETSQNSYFKDCQFNNAYGLAGFIVNSNISINISVTFENVQFNGNSAGDYAFTVFGAHASGDPALQYDGRNYKFINCSFNDSTNSANSYLELQGGLITQNVSAVTISGCQARNIVNLSENTDFTKVFGFFISNAAGDIPSIIANSNDVIIQDSIVSNLRNVGGQGAFGILTGGDNTIDAYGQQVIHVNTTVERCTVDQIYATVNNDYYVTAPFSVGAAGITDFSPIFPAGTVTIPGFTGTQASVSTKRNYIVRNNTIMDVHGVLLDINSGTNLGALPKSAAILCDSTRNPIVTDNQITDCDRGVLLSGFAGILPGPAGNTTDNIETCFQLALTPQDASAAPPVFVSLQGDYLEIVDHPELGVFPLTPTNQSPPLAMEITAPIGISDPLEPCDGPAGNVNGKIGLVQYLGDCGSATLTGNAQAGGDVATIIINQDPPDNFRGIDSQYNASVSLADGLAIIQLVNDNPDLQFRIRSNGLAAIGSTITNVTTGDSITLTSSDLINGQSFLCTTSDLSALGWMPGDIITYTPGPNGVIGGLDPTQTYYLIVYRPGFVEHGLIKNNEVTNCLVAGFQDDATETNSIFLSNIAYCNDDSNYAIVWAGAAPVTEGTPTNYPQKNQFEHTNVSITC